jgi:hypothetical protein
MLPSIEKDGHNPVGPLGPGNFSGHFPLIQLPSTKAKQTKPQKTKMTRIFFFGDLSDFTCLFFKKK